MSKRGENIFKRKDGRWEARYAKGYNATGKILYGYCYGRSYREARQKSLERRAEATLRDPQRERCEALPFALPCEEWLQGCWGAVKDSTYAKYETVLRRHILPELGQLGARELDTERVEEFKAKLLADGLSPKTVRDILAVLRAILKGAAARHPGAMQSVEIRCPKENRREVRVLGMEEQGRLVEYLKEDMDACKFGTLLALLTGLRIGELCALRWEDISLRNRTIRVAATLQRLKDLDAGSGKRTRIAIGPPKSEASVRTIPMSDSVFALCERCAPQFPGGYVLTGTEQSMEPRAVQRRMERYARDCDLPGVHFHTLRHTFATRCVEAGFELKSLSEVLGHANPNVTINRYVHASLEMKRQNMNRLARLGL